MHSEVFENLEKSRKWLSIYEYPVDEILCWPFSGLFKTFYFQKFYRHYFKMAANKALYIYYDIYGIRSIHNIVSVCILASVSFERTIL